MLKVIHLDGLAVYISNLSSTGMLHWALSPAVVELTTTAREASAMAVCLDSVTWCVCSLKLSVGCAHTVNGGYLDFRQVMLEL